MAQPLAVVPRNGPISIRVATMADLAFLDQLQKQHGRALGFFPRAQMEGYVRNEWVLIAEDAATGQPLGYCASRDRYLKRDELGVIYQLCVSPGHQRGLIGATLLRDVFQRSAYGCKLYCCWCAQDLAANHFWEAMGFVPIAFRAGSTKKKRVHIFWQRRIDRVEEVPACGGVGVSECEHSHADTPTPRHPDTPRLTPYWYPCNTNAGAMAEDRLVFPIPPGVHWRDIRPVEVQAVATNKDEGGRMKDEGKTKKLPAPRSAASGSSLSPHPSSLPTATISAGGLFFGAPEPVKAEKVKNQRVAKPKTPRVKAKADPSLVAKARELRDRYLEQANDRMLIAPSGGKYDVSRALASVVVEEKARPLLKAG